jgi:predicted amidohydrolase
MRLKTGIAQIAIYNNIAPNLAKISNYIESAVREEIDLLCFPECSLTGYIRDFNQVDRGEVDEALESIRNLALRNKVNVIVGTPYFETDKTFNSAIVLLTDNTRLVYNKNFLTSFDEEYFVPGNKGLSFEINGVKCGVLICRDQNYPSLSKRYAEQGVRAIFILAAHYYPPAEAWGKVDKNRALPIARAVENNVYVFKANAVGSQGTAISLGDSLIVNPQGLVISEADKVNETILSYEIN